MIRERDVIAAATPQPLGRHQKRMAVIAEVARLHGVKVHHLVAPSHIRGGKCRPVAYARFHAMARLRFEMRYTLEDVGRILGGRDHTTVRHGIARWQEIVAAEGAGVGA